MSEKVARLVSTALLLILFFAGAPVIAAIEDRGPPQEMVKSLSKQLDLSGDQKSQLNAIPDRDMD